mgnify:CR=1 FL=1
MTAPYDLNYVDQLNKYICAYKIGSGDITWKEILEKITDKRQETIYLPLPENDPKQRKPDISIAKERLTWDPVISMETGLLKTISYFNHYIV